MHLNVRRLREAAAAYGDNTDYAIAKRAKVSKSTMSRLVNGACLPSTVTIGKFRETYNVPADDLLVAENLPTAA